MMLTLPTPNHVAVLLDWGLKTYITHIHTRNKVAYKHGLLGHSFKSNTLGKFGGIVCQYCKNGALTQTFPTRSSISFPKSFRD